MSQSIRQRLAALRGEMARRSIDAYIIPTTDFHGSEYVNDYFKCREWMSGFTGSAGTLAVTPDKAGLWTDGRYFLQAEAQLKGSGIMLMKMGQPGVPDIEEWLDAEIPKGGTVGFDGRVIDARFGEKLRKRFNLKYDEDLVGIIWQDRPRLRGNKIREIPDSVTGETSARKLARLRKAMEEKKAGRHLITGLEEIAWLYNLRGSDVKYTPVFYAFALIGRQEEKIYALDTEGAASCLENRKYEEGMIKPEILPYFRIFEDIKKLNGERVLLDENRVSWALLRSLPRDAAIISAPDPVEMMKAIKNRAEIKSSEQAHIKDGIAMVNFIYWLKTNVGALDLTEISAARKLEYFRRSQKGCFDLSFETISGYMENGAIIHYAPSAATDKKLEPEGLLLVDSGGQYDDGTTDITRTISLGPLSDEMKEDYTAVLKANLSLSMAKFRRGTTGSELDEIARQPLRSRGLDFDHGTGHGVGHILSVHEGPNRISKNGGECPILPGMITTDEPGVYKEGKYGIRLENELLCTEGDMLGFRPLTMCPFDREAILPEMLTAGERSYLNNYHAEVFRTLSPYLDSETAGWLKEQTEEI